MIPDFWPRFWLSLLGLTGLFVGAPLVLALLLRRREFAHTSSWDCKTCMYNVGGGCRRYPPTRTLQGSKLDNPQAFDVTTFPYIENAERWWCGEYRRKD